MRFVHPFQGIPIEQVVTTAQVRGPQGLLCKMVVNSIELREMLDTAYH
jgi:hypothetical protein